MSPTRCCSVASHQLGEQQTVTRVTNWTGYDVTWGGQFENLERARGRLLIVVRLRCSIFILFFSAFGSVRDAVIVYTEVAFAIVGGVLALAVRGLPFSTSPMLGLLLSLASLCLMVW
jgi:Cu/Ag efflux pump CusA